MVQGSSLIRPRTVTGDGVGLVSHAGVAWLAETADASGLTAGLSAAMTSVPQRRHDPGRTLAQMILALAALISGDQFAVGQQMPSGYDIYNVPFDYRDRYADSSDEYYRYANGYVYRVDEGSGLIEEAFPVYA